MFLPALSNVARLTVPRRWVVERTFGWMMRWRRLVRDYERRIDASHAMILVAMGGNLLRRNAHP
jgi:transposase